MRSLPWRKTRDPYRILVSEVMLQQTQVERVIGKYLQFIKTFPDFSSLAQASLSDVLNTWQGLGYNRRAIALRASAEIVMEKYKGKLPELPEELAKLPGIGKYTSAALSVFAFQRPAIFIETNIRRVFLHFFFREREDVKDSEILALVENTIDRENPREWYYALMDYGVMLKKSYENPNRRSAHYRKQEPFHGSNRQARGKVLKLVLEKREITQKEITAELAVPSEKIVNALKQLLQEGFLIKRGKRYSIQERKDMRYDEQ
ncbi:MAG: A/G-specific adenine glycosylase [Proteobacteria bacterium]|nr:A/G-specific adenine glycosylase [Pseudomonadota bacterium]